MQREIQTKEYKNKNKTPGRDRIPPLLDRALSTFFW